MRILSVCLAALFLTLLHPSESSAQFGKLFEKLEKEVEKVVDETEDALEEAFGTTEEEEEAEDPAAVSPEAVTVSQTTDPEPPTVQVQEGQYDRRMTRRMTRGRGPQVPLTEEQKRQKAEEQARYAAERAAKRKSDDIQDQIQSTLMPYMKYFDGLVGWPEIATRDHYDAMPDIPDVYTNGVYLTAQQQNVLDALLSNLVKDAKLAADRSPHECKTTTKFVGVLMPIKVGESTNCGKNLDIGRATLTQRNQSFNVDETEMMDQCRTEMNVSVCSCMINGISLNPNIYASAEDSMHTGTIDGHISKTEYDLFMKSPTAFARYSARLLPATSILGKASAVLNTGAHISSFDAPNAPSDELARETALIVGSDVGDRVALCYSLIGTR